MTGEQQEVLELTAGAIEKSLKAASEREVALDFPLDAVREVKLDIAVALGQLDVLRLLFRLYRENSGK